MKYAILFLALNLFIGCESTKKQIKPPVAVTLKPIISDTSIFIGVELLKDGGDSNTIVGVCWGNKSEPTIIKDKFLLDSVKIMGKTVFDVESLIEKNKLYFYRGFSQNSTGIVYGHQEVFYQKAESLELDWDKIEQYSSERQPKPKSKRTKPVPSNKLKNREFSMYTLDGNMMGRVEFGEYRLKLKDSYGRVLSSQSLRGYSLSDTQTWVLDERWDKEASAVFVYTTKGTDGYIFEIGNKKYIIK